jgi:choline transport protein
MADMVKSYCCGVINVFAWIAICAGIAIIVPQLVLGMAIFWNSGYAPEPWHAFMLYQGANLLVLVYNIYVLKRSMWIHDVGCEYHLAGVHSVMCANGWIQFLSR